MIRHHRAGRPFHCFSTFAVVAVLPMQILSCTASTPPRAAALDPSNPSAPVSPFVWGYAPAGTDHGSPAHDERSDPDSRSAALPRTSPAKTAPEGDSVSAEPASDAGAVVYTCPMHPEVRQPAPGRCPKCGMKLVPAAPARPIQVERPTSHGAR